MAALQKHKNCLIVWMVDSVRIVVLTRSCRISDTIIWMKMSSLERSFWITRRSQDLNRKRRSFETFHQDAISGSILRHANITSVWTTWQSITVRYSFTVNNFNTDSQYSNLSNARLHLPFVRFLYFKLNIPP